MRISSPKLAAPCRPTGMRCGCSRIPATATTGSISGSSARRAIAPRSARASRSPWAGVTSTGRCRAAVRLARTRWRCTSAWGRRRASTSWRSGGRRQVCARPSGMSRAINSSKSPNSPAITPSWLARRSGSEAAADDQPVACAAGRDRDAGHCRRGGGADRASQDDRRRACRRCRRKDAVGVVRHRPRLHAGDGDAFLREGRSAADRRTSRRRYRIHGAHRRQRVDHRGPPGAPLSEPRSQTIRVSAAGFSQPAGDWHSGRAFGSWAGCPGFHVHRPAASAAAARG